MPHRRASWMSLQTLGAAWLLLNACGSRTMSEGFAELDGGQGGSVAGAGGQGGGFSGTGGQGGYIGGTGGQGGGFTGTGGQGGGFTGTGGQGGYIGETGGANTAGYAGGGGCANVGCPAIDCAPGYVSVTEPGACCPVCKPGPCTGTCAMPFCPIDSHLETPPGQCCPICVPGSTDACRKGQQTYFDIRKQMIEKYSSIGCKTNMDCTIVYETNRCIATCGTAFAVSIAQSAAQNLQSLADANCGSCLPPLPPPCVPPYAACINGRCSQGGPPLP
jgi:hypothetical protein